MSRKFALSSVGWLFLVGALLHATLGSRFVFYFSEQYQRVAWALFICALPVFAVLFTTEKAQRDRRRDFPTNWLWKGIILPVFVAMAAAMVALSPPGWIAAYTYAFGASRSDVAGQIDFVGGHMAGSKYCDQSGTISMGESVAEVCLEGAARLPMQSKQAVLVSGRESWFGFQIQEVAQR